MSDELAQLRAENQELKDEIEALRAEIEELRFEADLDACHAAGLTAQAKAIIAEAEACPNKGAHPMLDKVEYVNARTGEPMTKTRSYPLYREAFDAEAAELGVAQPEKHRA